MKKTFWSKIIISPFLFLILPLFESCHFHNNQDNSFLTIKLIQIIDEPENLFPRSAVPSIVPSIIEEYSEAFETLQWHFVLTDDNTLQSLIFNSYELPKNDGAFVIPVPKGNWKLSVQGEYFEGSVSDLLIMEDGFYNVEVPVYLIESGTGTIALKIHTMDSGITKVFVSNIFQASDSQHSVLQGNYYYADDSDIITIYKEHISSGTYHVLLFFFIDDICICSIPEIINVRKNCTTDVWSENPYVINGNICISQEKLNTLKGNMLFVKGEPIGSTDTTDSTDVLPYHTDLNPFPDGTAASPFNSIKKAIDVITNINDEETEYTIFVEGTVNEKTVQSTFENEQTDNSTLINIVSEKKLKLKLQGLSPGAKINAEGSEQNKVRLMNISGNVQLEISNLILTGGYTDENGSGIYISTPKSDTYNLILSGTTKITDNYTTNSGGGLYIDEGAILIKDNTEISSNVALTKGGGICILGKSGKDKRTLEIQGGTISNNSALSKNKTTGVGGGLYTQFATIHINNCVLSQNQAANGGGIGIAQNCNFSISNTLITENNAVYGADTSKGGGGIFASGVSSNLYLQDGCFITHNYTNSETSKGGGISITTTNVHICKNVNITENYYKSSSYGLNIQSNVSLASGKALSIDEYLANVSIGITFSETPEENIPVIFTHNYSKYNASTNPADFFFSDISSLTVTLSEQGEGAIIQ